MASPNVPRPPETAESNTSSFAARVKKNLGSARALVLAAIMGCTSGHGMPQKKTDSPMNEGANGVQVDNAPAHLKDGGNDHHHEKAELSPEVIEKLKENKEALEGVEKEEVQAYFDKLQKEHPLLVAEDVELDLCIGCIDERQLKGKSHGVAGVGVLLPDNELEVMVRNALDIARRKSEKNPNETVTIRIQPHGKSCGAAALARKLRNEKDMSPEAIAKEAMKGGERTAALVRERAKDLGIKVNVVVEEFDQQNFLTDPDHPAPFALVNYVNGTVTNKDAPDNKADANRTKRPLMFQTSAVIAGKNTAERDGLLAAIIAHSDHGYLKDAQNLPKTTPFRIVLAVDSKEEGQDRKKELEDMLKAHKDLAPVFQRGLVRVEVWVTSVDKK
jgi:hypothetical protein